MKRIIGLIAAAVLNVCAGADIHGYLSSLAKSDGGYGWIEQDDSFAEVTFAVAGIYHALGELPPNPDGVAEFIMRNPFSGKYQETRLHSASPLHLTFQQMQTLSWLGKKTDDVWRGIKNNKKVISYHKAYELGGNPPMPEVTVPILCRMIRGVSCDDLKDNFVPYFQAHRRANGTYNTTLASDGSDGHVVNTYHGLLAELAFEGRCSKDSQEWIRNCQQKDGGFTWSPNPKIGGVSDMYYVWHAVKALQMMQCEVKDRKALLEWVRSLRNSDGGFGDRPGAPSSPIATYRVADLFPELLKEPAPEKKAETAEDLSGLKAWAIQFQAPGEGSVAEAVELARKLKIHLWGAKNSSREWIEAARKKADECGVPVLFFASNEEYGTTVSVPGAGCFTHANDPVSPAAMIPRWPQKKGSWQEFQSGKIAPLKESGGLMVWQISDHEVFGRLVLDDSLLRGGYSLLSTFHFGCHNMAWTTPYLMRYRHEIAMIALQDSHGEAWWWRKHLASYKTIFLAEKPTWEEFKKAVAKNRVAAVRKDRWTHCKTRMLGGSEAVRKRLWELHDDWAIEENLNDSDRVSVTVVNAGDVFEPGRPKKGRALRIRLNREWIENKNLVFVDNEISLVRVLVDGKEVEISHVQRLVEDGWLKGTVKEDSFYVPLIDGCKEVKACFRSSGGNEFEHKIVIGR